MAIARKSGVSATGSLSRTAAKSDRHRPSVNQKKLSTHQEVAQRARLLRTNQIPLPAFSSPKPSEKRRRPSGNVPTSSQQIGLNTSGTPKTLSQRQERSKQKLSTIPVMPSQSMPLWLLRLYGIHRHSSIVAFLLVAATLVVYGLTVYSQEFWSQSYRKLQNLQRQERQLMTTNETLKNNMAKEAQKQPEKLVSPSPNRMIFLNPAPVTSNPPSNTKIPIPEIQQQTINPTGY
ncbi:hypothetical protein [Scytonema sp. NUACC21]